MKNSGGLKYAEKIMKKYQKEALDILSDFPKNENKKSLEKLVDYVISRKR